MPLLRAPCMSSCFRLLLTLIVSRHVLGADCWACPRRSTSPLVSSTSSNLLWVNANGDCPKRWNLPRNIVMNSPSPFRRPPISHPTSWSVLRGGAGGAPAVPSIGLVSLARKLATYVGASKTRCLATLFLSILGESLSTSLNKYAKVHGSVPAMVAACCLYLCT